MARSYDEAVAGTQVGLSDDAKRRGEVFAGAYKLAAAFMEIRARRGLTQVELAQLAFPKQILAGLNVVLRTQRSTP
jgi:hypothetical protein